MLLAISSDTWVIVATGTMTLLVTAFVGWVVHKLNAIFSILQDHEKRITTASTTIIEMEKDCSERLHWLREMSKDVVDTKIIVARIEAKLDNNGSIGENHDRLDNK